MRDVGVEKENKISDGRRRKINRGPISMPASPRMSGRKRRATNSNVPECHQPQTAG